MSGRYIAAGFRQDMELLLSKFIDNDQQNESEPKSEPLIRLRFSRFAHIWTQLNFSFIFKARINDNELREFIDEIYLEVLPNCSRDKPFERRVASLYLLYSLFVKQPQNKTIRQKIRFNYYYLSEMRELVDKSKQLDQLDVCYIWYKLLSLKAIDFVHVSRLMGPYYIRNSRVTNETETYTDFIINQFKASVYPSIDELSDIHEQYRIMKEALVEDKVKHMNTITQVEDNIFELCKAKMDNLSKEFANQLPAQESTQSLEDGFAEELLEATQDFDDIGSRRRKIKEKAMVNSSSNVSTDLKTNDTTTQVRRKRGRPKKTKLDDISALEEAINWVTSIHNKLREMSNRLISANAGHIESIQYAPILMVYLKKFTERSPTIY